MNSQAEQIWKLSGAVLALEVAVKELILTHHAPDAARQAVRESIEQTYAVAAGSTYTDAFLEGIQEVRRALSGE